VRKQDDPGNVPYYQYAVGNIVKKTYETYAQVDIAEKKEQASLKADIAAEIRAEAA
jgi:hypothetical protein